MMWKAPLLNGNGTGVDQCRCHCYCRDSEVGGCSTSCYCREYSSSTSCWGNSRDEVGLAISASRDLGGCSGSNCFFDV